MSLGIDFVIDRQQTILDLEARLAAIDKTIAEIAASGVQRKKIGDREVEFSNLADLQSTRKILAAQLERARGSQRNIYVRF